MRRNLVNALLIARYIMNHDTDIVRVSVMADVNGFIFHSDTKVAHLKDDFCGGYEKEDLIKAITAIGQDPKKEICIETIEVCGERGICFFNTKIYQ